MTSMERICHLPDEGRNSESVYFALCLSTEVPPGNCSFPDGSSLSLFYHMSPLGPAVANVTTQTGQPQSDFRCVSRSFGNFKAEVALAAEGLSQGLIPLGAPH